MQRAAVSRHGCSNERNQLLQCWKPWRTSLNYRYCTARLDATTPTASVVMEAVSPSSRWRADSGRALLILQRLRCSHRFSRTHGLSPKPQPSRFAGPIRTARTPALLSALLKRFGWICSARHGARQLSDTLRRAPRLSFKHADPMFSTRRTGLVLKRRLPTVLRSASVLQLWPLRATTWQHSSWQKLRAHFQRRPTDPSRCLVLLLLWPTAIDLVPKPH